MAERVFVHTGFSDSLAEWSKALASGASPQGRGFEPHGCQAQARLLAISSRAGGHEGMDNGQRVGRGADPVVCLGRQRGGNAGSPQKACRLAPSWAGLPPAPATRLQGVSRLGQFAASMSRQTISGRSRRHCAPTSTPRSQRTPCGTRTHNLRIRSPTPCPLGQGGLLIPRTCKIIRHAALLRWQGHH